MVKPQSVQENNNVPIVTLVTAQNHTYSIKQKRIHLPEHTRKVYFRRGMLFFFQSALPSEVFLLAFLCSLQWVSCSHCLLFHFTCFHWVKWGGEINEDKISGFTFHEHCFGSWQGVLLAFCRVFKLLLTLSFKDEVCTKTISDNKAVKKFKTMYSDLCSVCSLPKEIY